MRIPSPALTRRGASHLGIRWPMHDGPPLWQLSLPRTAGLRTVPPHRHANRSTTCRRRAGRRTGHERSNHSGTYSGTLRHQIRRSGLLCSVFVPGPHTGGIAKALYIQWTYWSHPAGLSLCHQALEARMHQRLRRQRQHDHGRYRKRTERHGATVDHDSDPHYRRHEERSLRRDVAAGQQQIKGCGGKRCGRRPFLDRKCQAVRETIRQVVDL
jgi:hypothetical protein